MHLNTVRKQQSHFQKKGIMVKSNDEPNKVFCARGTRSVCKNDSKTKILRPSVQKVRSVQRNREMGLHSGPFSIEINIFGKCRADIDNVAKGILDALNGVAYSDDRQCVELIVRRIGQNNF